jgi:hypothetical protein
MTPRDNEAILEFAEETPSPRDPQPAGAEMSGGELSPDGVFRVAPDTRAVPPPVQNEIDAIVDAISAGGRPRVASEPEPAAEADDADYGEYAIVPRELLRRSRLRFMNPAAFRLAAATIAAFALGGVIAWTVLRSFDAAPRSAAVHQPPAIEPATPAPTIPQRSAAPRAVAPAPATPPARVAATPAPRASASSPRPATTAPPAVSPRQDRAPAAGAPTRSEATAGTTARNASLPRTSPRSPVEAAPTPLDSTPLVPPVTARALVAPPPVIAAAPAGAPAPAVMAISRDRDAVLETVREYRQAYEAMDVTATAAIWPSVDRRALARAFSTLKSQALELQDCEVALTDTSATTRCRGTVEYVRKIGNPTPRTGHQEFIFKMRKLGDDWFIDDVAASQAAVARR